MPGAATDGVSGQPGISRWRGRWTSTRSRPSLPLGAARHVTSTRLATVTADREPSVCASASRSADLTSARATGPGSLHADVDDAPLLRHRVELGPGSVADDELGTPVGQHQRITLSANFIRRRWGPCWNWLPVAVWPPGRGSDSRPLHRRSEADQISSPRFSVFLQRGSDVLELLDPACAHRPAAR